MNRVQEQCPKIDSGTIPSQNRSKIGRVHRVHNPKPARAPRPRAPSACLPCALAPRLPHTRERPARQSALCACATPAARLPLAHASARAPAARPSTHAPAPQKARLRLLHAQFGPAPTACAPLGRVVAWLGTVSQYSPALPLPSSHNTALLYCNII